MNECDASRLTKGISLHLAQFTLNIDDLIQIKWPKVTVTSQTNILPCESNILGTLQGNSFKKFLKSLSHFDQLSLEIYVICIFLKLKYYLLSIKVQ